MNYHLSNTTALLAVVVFVSGGVLRAQETKEIGRTTEKELKVVLNASFGSLHIAQGEPAKVAVMESKKQQTGEFTYDYLVRNRVGYMDLTLGEGDSYNDEGQRARLHFANLKSGEWAIRFCDALPISFDIELGIGKGDINLSGLQVKDLNLSTGASDVCLAFDEPNRSTIENMNIEAGVSKFEGRNLGNANFRHFRFQGGVGTFKLDFGGEPAHEVDVDVQVGMGILTMVIPSSIGARVLYEKNWISRIECADDFSASGDNEYVSSNYESAKGKMIIRVESGVGSVRIKRSE
ncbi:MAG: hypothetical protein WB699_01185 [Bacteroidota bacterium]